MAMRILLRLGSAQGARHFIDVTSAHVDSCLYHGQAGLDFAIVLLERGGKVAVPTTLNVSSLDLLHPELYRGDPSHAKAARQLMDAYQAMGCRPTWTCAPYQTTARPSFGSHVAWAESNAIVFANSVLGARTNRYGDFIDICAAITGRVPAAGLHLEENRTGDLLLSVEDLPDQMWASDALFPLLGHLVGELAGSRVPVITGIEQASEDQLKAMGAAAASSGGVALFHVVGVTPEAPDLAAVFPRGVPKPTRIDAAAIREARRALSTTVGERLDAVSVGTPHASHHEISTLVLLLHGRRVAEGVAFYLSTGREVAFSAPEQLEALDRSGVRLVTDTCTYVTPILDPTARVVMTNSAKWAFYAPGNLGVEVVFGDLSECVESAVAGRVVHNRELWDD